MAAAVSAPGVPSSTRLKLSTSDRPKAMAASRSPAGAGPADGGRPD